MYESKNPASAITDGFNTIRINADARTEFIPLTFRLIIFPAWRKLNMKVARRTGELRPVTKANAHRISTVRTILRILSFPFKKKSRLKTNRLRIPTCNPDTTIIWIIPALIKICFFSGSRCSFCPRVIAETIANLSPFMPRSSYILIILSLIIRARYFSFLCFGEVQVIIFLLPVKA